MKYESPITCHSKGMAKLNVSFLTVGQTSRSSHKVKYFGTNRKVLSKGTRI
jgi:hypothetical protein